MQGSLPHFCRPLTISRAISGAATLALALALQPGCATAARPESRDSRDNEPALPNEPVTLATGALNACPRWKRDLSAHLSHVSISDDGRRILVSTSAESRGDARLRLMSGTGRLLWSKPLEQPVKSQSISRDGRYAAVNTYDGKLAAFDMANGRKLWDSDHLGRPHFLATSRRIVLLNDDDSEPKTAFVTYDFKGKLVASVSTEHEPLEMDVSEDESLVAITTTDRAVSLYRTDGTRLAGAILSGDPVSVRVVGGAAPEVYVLTLAKGQDSSHKPEQTLSAYALKTGSTSLDARWTTVLDRKYETLRAGGGTVFLYGNSHLGQALAAYSAATGTLAWKRSYSNPGSYSSLVFAKSSVMTVAIEQGAPAGIMDVLGIEPSGAARWDARVPADSGLYSYAYAPGAQGLVAGAGEPGNGVVAFYGLAPKACGK